MPREAFSGMFRMNQLLKKNQLSKLIFSTTTSTKVPEEDQHQRAVLKNFILRLSQG